jgi:hypothetical protein
MMLNKTANLILIFVLVSAIAFSNTLIVGAAGPDKSPPTVPTNVTASAAGSNIINLSWTASTDNVGVKNYIITRYNPNGTNSTFPTTATNFTDWYNLLISSNYSYTVQAADAVGNLSAASAQVSATTMSPGDNFTLIVEGRAPSTGNTYISSSTITVNAGEQADFRFTTSFSSSASHINPGYGDISSNSGQYQIIGDKNFGGSIWLSSNYGATWFNSGFSGNNRGICYTAVSGDGKYMLADTCENQPDGKLYSSSDYGQTWSQKESTRLWDGLAISNDGRYQLAVSSQSASTSPGFPIIPGYVYVSSDFGNTWTAKVTDATRHWAHARMSNDGKYQVAITLVGGNIAYGSSDFGNTWTPFTINGSSPSDIQLSDTGQYMTATLGNTSINLYVSTDFGATWTLKYSNPSCSPQGLAISANGSYQLLPVCNYTYSSNDGGNTWQQKVPSPYSVWNPYLSISGSAQYQIINSFTNPDTFMYSSSNGGVSYSTSTVGQAPYSSIPAIMKANFCPPSSGCAMLPASDGSSPPLKYQISQLMSANGFNYQPYFSVLTTASTTPGTYPITFSVQQNPSSCGAVCVTTKAVQINLVVNGTTVCQSGAVSLGAPSINVGSQTTATVPAGWSTVTFDSSDSSKATVSGANVTGVAAGTSDISGTGTDPNGVTGCPLDPAPITVTDVPTATALIKADDSDALTITAGQNVDITWCGNSPGSACANATSCTVSPTGWTGTSGSQTVAPFITTTYNLDCLPAGPASHDEVVVTVNGSGSTLNLTVNNVGRGAITSTSDPDQPEQIDCSQTCPSQIVPYQIGTEVTIVPDRSVAGRAFVSWGGSCAGTPQASDCVLTMDSDKTVIVNYITRPYFFEF